MSNRRLFFRDMGKGICGGVRQAFQAKETLARELEEVLATVTGTEDELTPFDADFFSSYELSYSLTLAYPREFFEQMAEKSGTAHAGVETLDLVQALHRQGVI